ncbi:hypothetical protein EDB89DRAFT_553434 [Lactarius sanguifluus]|nr:hypothetical protein EDB89DRAFT_553434 [Lactarius sanguifluus]
MPHRITRRTHAHRIRGCSSSVRSTAGRGAAHHSRTCGGAAGSRADRPCGRGGEHRAIHRRVPMMVQSLLRHAMAEVISEGTINSLVVTNSADANLEYVRMYEHLFTRDATAAAVWCRHTFSAAVERLTPETMRLIFEEIMPSLTALLPDSAEDTLGTRGMLQDAFKFSRVLHGALATRAQARTRSTARSFPSLRAPYISTSSS